MINQIKDAALIGDYLKQVKRQVRLEDNKNTNCSVLDGMDKECFFVRKN